MLLDCNYLLATYDNFGKNFFCRLFAWQPDKLRGERSKHECVVVIKNLFDPRMFDDNLGLIIEYREDIKEECLKCGVVKKVVIYDVSLLTSIFFICECLSTCLCYTICIGEYHFSRETNIFSVARLVLTIKREKKKENNYKRFNNSPIGGLSAYIIIVLFDRPPISNKST